MANGYYSSPYSQWPPVSLHLCFFFVILLLFLGFSWYINYESMFEDLMIQFKLMLMLCPLLLLLVVHWLSSEDRRRVPFVISLPGERDSVHRAGGTPWGVGALLVFLLFMISYQSSFQERWFPLLTR
ncbi:uncharacterized protein LOC122061322 [Macadamia integrifolia]|uniref:uncharacterized protein LOC122061322 n=1 Tax=Macadamia integrifolia TaxID=60698 RepID=UPI001C52C8FF|nr:uncharacterized protein LOC122061322 [Macadamia integrifolia]